MYPSEPPCARVLAVVGAGEGDVFTARLSPERGDAAFCEADGIPPLPPLSKKASRPQRAAFIPARALGATFEAEAANRGSRDTFSSLSAPVRPVAAAAALRAAVARCVRLSKGAVIAKSA